MQDKCDTQPITASIELCRIMEKHSSALTCVRFSSNGLYIASSGLDKTVVIWETVIFARLRPTDTRIKQNSRLHIRLTVLHTV